MPSVSPVNSTGQGSDYDFPGATEVDLWEAEADHFQGFRKRHVEMGSSDPELQPIAGASRWEAQQITGAPRGKETRSGIDTRGGRFPCSIVWTALPGITSCFPIIGHMGIADSRGVVYDFAGPYHIGTDDLAFGRCLRYIQLDPSLCTRAKPGQSAAEAWDAAVDSGNDEYCQRMHNICCDNCHSHVARVLNEAGYPLIIPFTGRRVYGRWNMVVLGPVDGGPRAVDRARGAPVRVGTVATAGVPSSGAEVPRVVSIRTLLT